MICSGIKNGFGMSCKTNCDELISQCSSKEGDYKILLQNKLYAFTCVDGTKRICNWETDELCVKDVINECAG